MVRTSVAVHARQTREALVCSFQPRHVVEGSVGARVLAIETRAFWTVVAGRTGLRVLNSVRTERAVLHAAIAIVTGSARIAECLTKTRTYSITS